MSDLEDTSDIEENSEEQNAAGGKDIILSRFRAALSRKLQVVIPEERPLRVRWKFLFERTGPDADDPYPSVPIPDPYPISPPDMEELPDCWYVVDRGTEVGIFADK